MNNKSKAMHPEDKQNLVIFLICCFGVIISFDIFIHQPNMERIRMAQELAANQGVDTQQPSAPALSREQAVSISSNRVEINSDTLKGSIRIEGGRIDDLSLKNYMTEPQGEETVKLLNPSNGPFGYYGQFGWVAQDSSLPMPASNTQWTTNDNRLGTNDAVTLQWNNGQGLNFINEIALDDRYMFTVTQSVRNNSGQAVTLFPFALIGRSGMPEHMTGAFILHEGPIGYIGEELHEVDYGDLDDQENESYTAEEGWIGMTDKYWLTALTKGKDYQGEVEYRFTGTPRGEDITYYQTDLRGDAIILQPGESVSVPIEFFAGPKIVDMLEDYEEARNFPHFDLAVDFGILYFLTRPIYELLSFLNNLVGNFAVALLILTVLLRLAVFPLAQKSFRSFARMRKVTPQMVEIREKYGDDRMQLQQKIYELYQRENVNPVAGCIPILIQIPIFFALYKVFYINIGMRHEPFWGWIDDMSAADPTNLFEAFGLIPWGAPGWLHIGAWPIIMCTTLVLQQRLSPPPQDKTQRIMMGIMPYWMTLILANFPVGLVIYWSWSNTLSVLQQYILLRQEGVRVNIFTRSRSEKELEAMIDQDTESKEDKDVIDHDDIEPETKDIKPKQRRKKR